VGRFSHREHDGDYYTQPGQLFRLMTPEQRKRLIGNITGGLSQTPRHILERQLEHLYKADPAYGEGVAKPLGISVRELVAAK
jgi:catalase